MTDNATPEEADETQELLVRIQGGDAHAFDELFARHRAEVHRAVARRIEPSLRSRVDPSDVVQEAQLDPTLRLSDFIERRPMPFRLRILRTAVQRLLKLKRQATAARRDAGRDRPLDEPFGPARGAMASLAIVQQSHGQGARTAVR
jgi:RNA polymerase sigma-70 factor, ECF subfamily